MPTTDRFGGNDQIVFFCKRFAQQRRSEIRVDSANQIKDKVSLLVRMPVVRWPTTELMNERGITVELTLCFEAVAVPFADLSCYYSVMWRQKKGLTLRNEQHTFAAVKHIFPFT